MKGPGHKQKLDVRRTWKCPACGKERKLQGDVTTLMCDCREGGTFMAIVTEKIVAPRPYQPLNEHDVRSAEFGIDDMPVLMPHPSSLPPERPNARRSYNEPPKKSEEARPESAVAPTALAPPQQPPPPASSAPPPAKLETPPVEEPDDDWGEGIL
ncbi:MAG: hypothetical protein H7062_22860 [Candidatus Saccharimonas sp.]|nr:hypothetical protein [Planctomycetaceae bacterium]